MMYTLRFPIGLTKSEDKRVIITEPWACMHDFDFLITILYEIFLTLIGDVDVNQNENYRKGSDVTFL